MIASLVAATLPLLAMPVGAADASPRIGFGMDAASVGAQTAAGVAPDYGTFWLGPWTLSSGWGGPDGQMDRMKAAGVTPAIHFYYWGDDISVNCVENGCWSSLHNAWKDRAGWQKLALQLGDHLNARMGGQPVVIFLETEFNKGNVATYEPLDGYLAEKAAYIKARYPAAQIVLSLGNWNSAAWGTFDRTAAASDYTGIQGMRGSTRNSPTDYRTLYETSLAGAQKLQAQFGKPVFLQDLALSSYPEPDYLDDQAAELREFFTGMQALRDAGVQAMIYRSWTDAPNMDLANWFGEAERHWGLAWANGGGAKPSAQVWVDGVKAARSPGNQAPSAVFTATTSGLGVSLDAAGSADPDGDALSYAWNFGDGSAGAGMRATHAYAAPGTYTVRLTVSDGQATATATGTVTAVQPNRAPLASFTLAATQLQVSADGRASTDADGDALTHAWDWGDGTTGTGPTASHTYAAAGTYTVRLTVSDGKAASQATRTATVAAPAPASVKVGPNASPTWMEVYVTSSAPATKVEVQANGAWTSLAKTSWGSWAKAMTVAKGSSVAFRVTDASGQITTTPSQPYLGAATSLSATFTPRAVGNDWWVEVGVKASAPLSKVEAKVGSGAWTTLPATSWGTHAKSIHAPNGSQVQFRALDASGNAVTSPLVKWT